MDTWGFPWTRELSGLENESSNFAGELELVKGTRELLSSEINAMQEARSTMHSEIQELKESLRMVGLTF